MIKKNQELLNRLNLLSDGLLVFASFFSAYYIRFYLLRDGIQNLPARIYVYAAAALIAGQMILYALVGLYQPQRKRRLRRQCADIVLVNLFSIIILQALLFFFRLENFSRFMLVLFFVLETLCVCGKHVAARMALWHMRKKGFNQKYIILVGSGKSAKKCCNELNRLPELGSQVIGYLSQFDRLEGVPYLGRQEELMNVLETVKPDEVIAALEDDEQFDFTNLIYACDAAGVRLSLIPAYAGHRTTVPQIDMINDIPLLVMRRIPLDSFFNAALKRCADLVGAALLLVVLSPLMIVVSIGVKCSSPGPVLFRQTRVGYRRTPFVMYKFRSMYRNAEENSAWTTDDDPRRTPFGAFLRKWSIDELPQLFNVLRGEMSLVGPRPELPAFVEKFRKDIPAYMIKHLVRPGMTGYAQINGYRGDTAIDKRIELDIYYIENWSPWLDLKILVKTAWHLKNEEQPVHRRSESGECVTCASQN